jgi:hypothetical protein
MWSASDPRTTASYAAATLFFVSVTCSLLTVAGVQRFTYVNMAHTAREMKRRTVYIVSGKV